MKEELEKLKKIGILGEQAMKLKVTVLLHKRKIVILERMRKATNADDVAVLSDLGAFINCLISDINKIKEGNETKQYHFDKEGNQI